MFFSHLLISTLFTSFSTMYEVTSTNTKYTMFFTYYIYFLFSIYKYYIIKNISITMNIFTLLYKLFLSCLFSCWHK